MKIDAIEELRVKLGLCRSALQKVNAEAQALRDENAKLRAEIADRREHSGALAEKLAEYMLAFPVCAAHAPNGGARSGCPVCHWNQIIRLVSEIDVAAGGDAAEDFDETKTLERVKALARAVADAEVALNHTADADWYIGTNPEAEAALERFRSRNKQQQGQP